MSRVEAGVVLRSGLSSSDWPDAIRSPEAGDEGGDEHRAVLPEVWSSDWNLNLVSDLECRLCVPWWVEKPLWESRSRGTSCCRSRGGGGRVEVGSGRRGWSQSVSLGCLVDLGCSGLGGGGGGGS